jgi:ferrous iron transport protein B
MELPNYRLPGAKNVFMLLKEKAGDFLQRAFTVIFFASLIIWALQNFSIRFDPVSAPEDSILALLARLISPLFSPLGFGFWQAAVALIAGFMAKEAVVSTLAILMGTSVGALPLALSGLFSPAAAFAFLVFVLLYTPCVAAIATVRRELGSRRAAAGVVAAQCLIAWGAAWAAHVAAGVFGG